MKNVKKFWKWLSPYKWRFILTVAFGLITSVMFAMGSLSIANMINAIVRQNSSEFILAVGISLIFYGSMLLTSYLFDRNVAALQENIAYDMRLKVVKSLAQTDYKTYRKQKSNTYVAVMLTDLEVVSQKILTMFFRLLSNVFNLIASAAALMYLHIFLVVAAFVLAFLMFNIPTLFRSKMQENAQNVAQKNGVLLEKANHWISGFSVLNDFNAKEYLLKQLHQPIADIKHAQLKDKNLTAVVSVVSGILSIMAQVGMIVFAGFLVLQQVILVGALMSAAQLSGMIFGPLGTVVVMYNQFQSGFGTLEKIEHITTELSQCTTQDNVLANDMAINSDKLLLPPLSIKTKGVAVTFDDGRFVKLPDIDIEDHKNYAIIGPSGVGKSVFLNIIAKNITGYDGIVYINDTDLSRLSERAVKDIVAYVPQSPFIFNMSVKDNIVLSNPNASQEIYEKVVEQAGLKAVFDSWPNKDNTLIGELHTQISGGQAQRISIARALMTQKPIMLFDEVTANLDKEVAHAIEEVIATIPNCVKPNVTHRLSEKNKHFYDDVITFYPNDKYDEIEK